MPGTYQYDVEIKSNVAKLLSDMKQVQDRLDTVEGKEYKIKLNVDEKKLSNVISNLEKMLDSLGKGTGDFKQFENLSKELLSIVSEVQSLSKAFGKVDDSGAKTLLSSIQNIDKSLSELSQNILNVNKNMSNMGGNTSGAVKQVENITNESKKAASALEDVAKAQAKVNGQKTNISSGNTNPPNPPKKDRYAKRRKISEEDFLNYSPNRINEKLSDSGYTILGETVNTELVDGLVKVSAKIKDAEGAWKSFSAKVDADGNIFEQRFKTVTNGVDKLETALQNFGRETAPALTYQKTLDKAQKIKNSLNLGDEYSIKVDSSEFVTITKKLTDVDNAGASVTQTFKSAQDAIDNFGKAASNSAEKTSVALKSVKSNVKEVVDETEKLANAQKEQNANVNLNKYDKQLDSYNGKVDKYQATIARFNDGGWTSDTYLKNVQAVHDAVKQYATLLDNIKTNQNGIASDEDIQNLDKYEKKIKDTIATVTNMSASEKGYNFVSAQKELDKIHKLLNENSKMSSEAKAKIKSYYAEIESGNPSMSLDRIHGEIMKIYNAEVEAGRAGRSFFDTLKNSGFHQLAAQMAGMFGVYDVINELKQVASTVRELDTAYTEMRKVSNESAQSLKNFQKESFSTADSVGTTALALQDATATWMRLGESLDEAKESAKDATVLLNVSEFENIDEATDSLVAMSQAYKELDKMEIIDVLDKIGNEYSISTNELSTALKDSAAVLKTQGNDLAESVALITAGNAITQDVSKTAGETLPERYRNIFYRTYLTARAA